MPIYEFKCRDCDRDFARFVRIGASEKDLQCPHCDSGAVERIISSFSSSCAGNETSSAAAPACSGFT